LGFGLVTSSGCASDRSPGGPARISKISQSEHDERFSSILALLRPDACLGVDRRSIVRPVHPSRYSSVVLWLRRMVGGRPSGSTAHPAGLGPIRRPFRKQSPVVHHRLYGADLA